MSLSQPWITFDLVDHVRSQPVQVEVKPYSVLASSLDNPPLKTYTIADAPIGRNVIRWVEDLWDNAPPGKGIYDYDVVAVNRYGAGEDRLSRFLKITGITADENGRYGPNLSVRLVSYDESTQEATLHLYFRLADAGNIPPSAVQIRAFDTALQEIYRYSAPTDLGLRDVEVKVPTATKLAPCWVLAEAVDNHPEGARPPRRALTNGVTIDIPIADNFATTAGLNTDTTEAAQRATYYQQHLIDTTFYAAQSHIHSADSAIGLAEMQTDALFSSYGHGGGYGIDFTVGTNTSWLSGHSPAGSPPANTVFIREGSIGNPVYKDLSRLRLAIFFACDVAEGHPDYGNLLDETRNAGADCVVGWQDWSQRFWQNDQTLPGMAAGTRVEEAVNKANELVIASYRASIPAIEEMREWRFRGDENLLIVPAAYGYSMW